MFHHEENGDTDFIPGYFVDPKVDYHQAIASNVLPSQNQPSLGESEGVEIRVHPKAVKRFNELVDTATTLVLQIDIMGRPRMESQEVQLKKTFQEFQVHPDIDKSESA
nr:hypothetical protein BDOA9_0124710 [Bradyrhizobium sp. DOA9]